MVENKTTTGGMRRMGQERWKYLDMANLAFAAGEYVGCKGYINAFLETIDGEGKAGLEINDEFNRIESDRKSQTSSLMEEIKDLGYLEQGDLLNRGRERIEVDAIYSQKTVCWTVAMKHGLFLA